MSSIEPTNGDHGYFNTDHETIGRLFPCRETDPDQDYNARPCSGSVSQGGGERQVCAGDAMQSRLSAVSAGFVIIWRWLANGRLHRLCDWTHDFHGMGLPPETTTYDGLYTSIVPSRLILLTIVIPCRIQTRHEIFISNSGNCSIRTKWKRRKRKQRIKPGSERRRAYRLKLNRNLRLGLDLCISEYQLERTTDD